MSTVRINMWAGPRNISTTMMRAFENRPDTAVLDEPFYAAYLQASGAEHPMREEILASLPRSWAGVVDLLDGPVPHGRDIRFHKHIAYHIADAELDLDWLLRQRTFLLIRDPRAMVASYVKKFDDVAPITASFEVQIRIFEFLSAHGISCPVVDASDVLKAPRAMLTALCHALGIPFTDKMLSWPPGPRESDGVWGPHWYDAVTKSTGFKPFEARQISLAPELAALARTCAGPYEFLHERRLKA
ncbi:MAG: HAD family hydrolase [Alphaproteobacteria bacterium]